MYDFIRKTPIAIVLLLLIVSGYWGIAKASVNINGSGSSAVEPVLQALANAYYEEAGIQINYQATGSSGGLRNLSDGMVDFAAADMPLFAIVDQVDSNAMIEFPFVFAGAVPVVNLEGITDNDLTLSGQVLVDMYLGHIKHWDDPAIVELNPDLMLPHESIIRVRRSDASGTSYNVSNYFYKVSDSWQDVVGEANTSSEHWPKPNYGGNRNAGVAALVQQAKHTIGYVEHGYAEVDGLAKVKLINQAGHAVTSDTHSLQSAAAAVDWLNASGADLIPSNQSGVDSWPLTMAVFIMLRTDIDHKILTELIDFFDWVNSETGRRIIESLGYVAVPESVHQITRQQLINLVN